MLSTRNQTLTPARTLRPARRPRDENFGRAGDDVTPCAAAGESGEGPKRRRDGSARAFKPLALGLGLLISACGQPAKEAATHDPAVPPERPTARAAGTPSPAAKAELIRLEEEYARALVRKDRDFLMGFYAADWRGGNWTGFWTKSRMIGSVMDGRYVVTSMTLSNVEVRIIGDVAVVQGVDDEISAVGGRDTSGRWAFTDIFERRGGRWVAVASHTTEMRRE